MTSPLAGEEPLSVASIPSPRRRSGRRPGTSGTRDAILKAARKVFAQRGYGGATMRAIAREADVDAALIHHFFESKSGVFKAAVEHTYPIPDMVEEIVGAGAEGMGDRLVRGYLRLWTNPETHDPLLALIRSAVSDEEASGLMHDFTARNLVAPLLHRIQAPDLELRAALVGSQLLGLAVVRYVIRLEPLASADSDTVAMATAPTIQRYLAGDLSSSHPPSPAPWMPSVPVPPGSQGLFREPRF